MKMKIISIIWKNKKPVSQHVCIINNCLGCDLQFYGFMHFIFMYKFQFYFNKKIKTKNTNVNVTNVINFFR